ncbi:phage protein [Pectobacterium carotovorum]|uniref:phage protein n=1 Tax=Pectobacterium carotovorum TaxID=554 RepID=UPI000583328D|nr:phage protein [Pectobacterium carotovorum]KHS86525.1 phage protein [Pectobacterium carotovorum subsp. carotovorum]
MSQPQGMKPLASTVRVVEWDELPPRARDIPSDFNPLAEGVLMAHQVECLKLDVAILAIPKGRRTGITYAWGLNSTLIAGARKSAGGSNVYYIGDTKEKGLEFIGYVAKFARVIAQQQATAVSSIEEFLFEDQDNEGNTRQITAYRVRFASGMQVAALSSRPANIRGLQGVVIIDEAAFHPDVQGVLDAATALLIWGGRIVVISSHNGKNNPFNQFCNDIEEGRYGANAAVFTVTFDDAVANGLYERVCAMAGKEATVEGKKAWYEGIRNGYGPRKAAMREELDAIPRDGNGVCIPGVWIERAMPEERPVVRLVLDDDFINMSELERQSWGDDWLDRNLRPVMEETLNPECRHVFGMDFARHRHFSALMPMAIQPNLLRDVPFLLELNNVPSALQQQILFWFIDHLPRQSGGAIDATGPGMVLAEYTADRYGRPRIAEITLNRQWYGLWMPKFTGLFEDSMILLPRDENTAQDLRTVENIDGVPMVARLERKDLKDPELVRHGDVAIAGCLANYAALNLSSQIEFQSAGARSIHQHINGYGASPQGGELTDTGFGTVRGMNDFGGFI